MKPHREKCGPVSVPTLLPYQVSIGANLLCQSAAVFRTDLNAIL